MLRPILSLALIASLATVALAQPPSRDGDRSARGRADGAKGRVAKDGAEGRPGRGPQAMSRRGGLMGADPEVVAAKMMKEFDKDGDSKLNSTELVALLKSLRERAQGGRPGMQGSDGARRQRPDGIGRRGDGDSRGKRPRGRDGEGAAPGGDKPKRPGSNDDQ